MKIKNLKITTFGHRHKEEILIKILQHYNRSVLYFSSFGKISNVAGNLSTLYYSLPTSLYCDNIKLVMIMKLSLHTPTLISDIELYIHMIMKNTRLIWFINITVIIIIIIIVQQMSWTGSSQGRWRQRRRK